MYQPVSFLIFALSSTLLVSKSLSGCVVLSYQLVTRYVLRTQKWSPVVLSSTLMGLFSEENMAHAMEQQPSPPSQTQAGPFAPRELWAVCRGAQSPAPHGASITCLACRTVLVSLFSSLEHHQAPGLLFYRNKCLIHPVACIGLPANCGAGCCGFTSSDYILPAWLCNCCCSACLQAEITAGSNDSRN